MTERPSPPTPASRVSAFTLANGLRASLREDNRAPLVSVQLWYHGRASQDKNPTAAAQCISRAPLPATDQ